MSARFTISAPHSEQYCERQAVLHEGQTVSLGNEKQEEIIINIKLKRSNMAAINIFLVFLSLFMVSVFWSESTVKKPKIIKTIPITALTPATTLKII